MIQWLVDNQDLATLIFAGIVAFSTVVYAVLTAFLVFETRKMRQVQTNPRLEVYFDTIEEFVNFGHLYVKNIGLGPAFDISFKITHEGSKVGANKTVSDFSKTKFLDNGLNYLGPNQEVKSGYTSFHDDYDEKMNTVLMVELQYSSSTKQVFKEAFRIDFSEFEGRGSLGTPHLYSIAESLKKIQADVGHLSSGLRKLQVDTFTEKDRVKMRKRREQDQKEIEESYKNHTKPE